MYKILKNFIIIVFQWLLKHLSAVFQTGFVVNQKLAKDEFHRNFDLTTSNTYWTIYFTNNLIKVSFRLLQADVGTVIIGIDECGEG